MNIYSKLTLLCLFLVIGSTSILSFFVDRKFEEILKQEILSAIQIQALEAMSDIERFVGDRTGELEAAAKSSNIQLAMGDTIQLDTELRELESLNNLFFSLSYFDLSGNLLADSKGRTSPDQEGKLPFTVPLSTEDPVAVEIAFSTSLGREVMYVGVLVTEEVDNTPMGMLVGSVLMDEIYKFLSGISLGENYGGTVNIDLLGKDREVLFSNSEGERQTGSPNRVDMVSTALEDSLDYIESHDMIYFIARQQVTSSLDGMSIVISVEKSIVFSPLLEIRKDLIWIFIPVLIGSIIVALIAANLFVRPLVKLSRAAEDLGKGKLNVDLDFKTNDEVGKLARQLNRTSRILIKRIRQQRAMNKKLEDQKDKIAWQKTQIEAANRQMTDSISYARRIQRSILPDPSGIRRVLKQFMLFYEPKDIISGDFYWFERVRKGRNDYMVIACADCTGHGVPGAIMSIMGSNQLTNIVYYQNYLDPRKIIARLDKAIKFELYAREGEELGKDGIEIGVCAINLDENTIEFAGAGLPLYRIQNGELEEFKTIKEMVGAIKGEEREVESQLIKHHVELEKGDRFYMATDGYQDQFGGPDDRKFMVKNFRGLLQSLNGTSLADQEDALKNKLMQWKGTGPLTDDVLVMGFEI